MERAEQRCRPRELQWLRSPGGPAGRVIVWVDDSSASLAALRRAVTEARRANTILYPVRVVRTRLTYQGNMPSPTPAPVAGVGQQRVQTASDQAMGGLPAGVQDA